jgi:hypothetical protein
MEMVSIENAIAFVCGLIIVKVLFDGIGGGI